MSESFSHEISMSCIAMLVLPEPATPYITVRYPLINSASLFHVSVIDFRSNLLARKNKTHRGWRLKTSGNRDIKVVICDPRLMRKFIKLANELGLTYSVPKKVKTNVTADIVIIDNECLDYYEIDSSVAYLVTDDNVKSVVSEIAGIRRAMVLMVGVDLGAYIAYAVFADKELIDVGKVRRPENFFQRISELIDIVEPHKVIVKVGMPETNSVDDTLEEIIEGLLRRGYVTYLVDESRTSIETPKIVLKKLTVKDDDILASINIALRNGIRVT